MNRSRESVLRTISIAAIFISLEIAALALLSHNSQMHRNAFGQAATLFRSSVWGSVEKVGWYFGLRQENDSLSRVNLRLQSELSRQALEPALAASDCDTVGNFVFRNAMIVRQSTNSRHNYFILDKGRHDGISEGSGVITPQGAVGIVDAVSDNYSYVISFRNPRMVVSARLGHTGAVGTMNWTGTGDDQAYLNDIPNHVEISPSDTVFTSGYSSLFPPDVPLGTVMDYKVINGANFKIRVRLFEGMTSLKWVTVSTNLGKMEIDELSSR